MCGLLASSGAVNPRIIRALGILNAQRGKDSAGVGWWDNEPCFLKIARHPYQSFTLDLSDAIDLAASKGVVIGHTRYATTGEVCSDNAHPFVADNIVFAHNGVIHNYRQFGEFAVDSQCLIQGIKKSSFEEFEGSIALVWIDQGKLKAYRSGNPLWRGVVESAVYLSSQEEHLKAVGAEGIKELAEGHLYTFEGHKVMESPKIGLAKRQKIGYTSSRWSVYFDRQVWEEQKKMIAGGGTGLECQCGHFASKHEPRHSEAPACYNTGKDGHGLCPCSAFELPYLARPKTMAICECGHPHSWHGETGKGSDCSVCVCLAFKFSHRINAARAEEETPCICGHEREYHEGQNMTKFCMVSKCPCVKFEKAPPGWLEAWRKNKPLPN